MKSLLCILSILMAPTLAQAGVTALDGSYKYVVFKGAEFKPTKMKLELKNGELVSTDLRSGEMIRGDAEIEVGMQPEFETFMKGSELQAPAQGLSFFKSIATVDGRSLRVTIVKQNVNEAGPRLTFVVIDSGTYHPLLSAFDSSQEPAFESYAKDLGAE